MKNYFNWNNIYVSVFCHFYADNEFTCNCQQNIHKNIIQTWAAVSTGLSSALGSNTNRPPSLIVTYLRVIRCTIYCSMHEQILYDDSLYLNAYVSSEKAFYQYIMVLTKLLMSNDETKHWLDGRSKPTSVSELPTRAWWGWWSRHHRLPLEAVAKR